MDYARYILLGAPWLVRESREREEEPAKLLAALDETTPRDLVTDRVHEFFRPRQGGTRQACQLIIDHLKSPRGTLP